MKYFGGTISYLKKNFWLPTVAMLVPAVIACFLSTPYWEVVFVAAFDFDPYKSVSVTFRILFGDSWQYLWPVVVVAIFQVFGASLAMSAIDRHFRTGKLSLQSPWRMINNSVFSIAVGVTIMSIFSIVWRFLLFGLVMLVQVIIGAIGLSPGAALSVISVVAVVMFALHGMIIVPMLFWAPVMFIYGYKFRDAAAAAFKMLSGQKVYLGLFLPMVLCAGIQLTVGFFSPHIAVTRVVGCIIFLFTNVYAVTYTMITFYGVSGLDRRDVAPYRKLADSDRGGGNGV